MATFHYKANRADQTQVEGHIDAENLESAHRALKEQGLVVTSVQQVESPQAEKPTSKRQVDHVLTTGKHLAPALRAYSQELPAGKRRNRLQKIADQLEQGHGPSIEPDGGPIDEEWIQLRIMGALSHDANQISSEIIDEFQREDDLRGRFAAAIAYPLVMLAASAAVLLFITLLIIPVFREMFLDFGLQLPAVTYVIFGISNAVENYWWAILIPAVLLAAFSFFNSKFRNGIIQRIPVVGSTMRLADQARFFRYLANLIEAEIPIAEALRISGQNIGQTNLRRDADRFAAEMDSGNTSFHPPSAFRHLPRTVIHALQLQDNSRAGAQLLRELSRMYDQKTQNRLTWIPSLIEPVFIVLLGTIVGFYVVALFLPLIKLIDGLN